MKEFLTESYLVAKFALVWAVLILLVSLVLLFVRFLPRRVNPGMGSLFFPGFHPFPSP